MKMDMGNVIFLFFVFLFFFGGEGEEFFRVVIVVD